jgi:hypothetical protein
MPTGLDSVFHNNSMVASIDYSPFLLSGVAPCSIDLILFRSNTWASSGRSTIRDWRVSIFLFHPGSPKRASRTSGAREDSQLES